MPAIRLADIPNTPDVPTFDRAIPGVDPNLLNNQSASLAFLSEISDSIADTAMEFHDHFREAKDAADTAKADTIMRSAWEKQMNEQEKLAPEEWGNAWGRNLNDAKREIAGIRLHPSTAKKINSSLDNWSQLTGIRIEGQALKKQIDIMESDVSLNFNKRLAQDDIEGAMVMLDEAKKKRAIRPEVANALESQAQDNIFRKAKAERNANIESAIILNPQKWERDLTGGLETGSSKLQTDLSREEINRLYPFAKQQARLAESDKMEVFYNLIFKNEFQTTEELKAAMGDKTRPDLMPNVELPERAKQNLIKTFTLTHEQQDEAMKLFPAHKHMAEAYDGADDPDMEKYISIGNQIRMLPEGRRDELLDILGAKHRAYRETKKPIPASALTSIEKRAEADLKAGGFGKWITDENGNVTEDTRQARDEAYLRYDQEMTALKRWAKANPEKAQDDIEVQRAYNDIITQQNKLDAAAGRKPTRRPVDIPSLKTAPAQPAGVPDPDEILRSSPTGASAPGKPVGKVTSYNFPGDPYSDTNSRNLIGAWNNTLTESSLAISPDIEKKFKTAGIEEGDAVELVLADGTRVVRNWDDRTMQDEEAIKRFGKPLRGRFDFHQPRGKYENDGIAVVSFRKATAA